MKNIYYVIIPIVAFCLILTNAFFGHLIFASETQQVIHKYSVYVHLLSDWNSSSKNIIFDVTNSWYKSDKKIENSVLNEDSKIYNTNQLQSIHGKSYVELNHEFSDCEKIWQPEIYRKAVDTVRHGFEYTQGKQLSANPNISVYPDVDNTNYNNSEQQIKIKNGFVQFVPICTSKNVTSYDYSIKTDNKDVGLDVYFVSSFRQLENFSSSDFESNKESDCSAQNKQSFSGRCNNIQKSGGLLVIFPDEIKPWTTKVTVNLYEKEIID